MQLDGPALHSRSYGQKWLVLDVFTRIVAVFRGVLLIPWFVKAQEILTK